MTFVNPYPVDLPGLREAMNFKLQSITQGSLTVLNEALHRDDLSPIPIITSDQVVLGDPQLVNQTLICIIGGGRDDATDMETASVYLAGGSETGSYGETLYTLIKVLLYKNDLAALTTVATMVQAQEVTLARITDHLRKRVFNSMQYYNLTLASQEHYPDGDIVTGCRVKNVKMGVTGRGYGSDLSLPYAELLHVGEINVQIETFG